MWRRFWRPLVIVVPSAAVILAGFYVIYWFIDPIPPRHFVIAAGMAGSGYDNRARQYARILARDGVELKVRNAAGAVEDLDLLRDRASGVQAALTALGFSQPRDAAAIYSLGGVFDAPITFSTRMPSRLPSLRNCAVSACPSARREPLYAAL
jgi:hypothetical protein